MANNPSMFDPKPQAKTTQQAQPNVRALPQAPKPESKQQTESAPHHKAHHLPSYRNGALHGIAATLALIFFAGLLIFMTMGLIRDNNAWERWTARREVQNDALIAASDKAHPEVPPNSTD